MLPNIVLIVTDQQRKKSLGAYGCRYVCTPCLDALAGHATVYEHCYCDAPVCTPSRACLLTGKTLPGHKVYNLFDILPREEKLLPFYLKQQGYDTALVGKLHVSGIDFEARERNPGDGFDLYELCHEPSLYLDSPFNGYARWLQTNFPEEYEAVRREGRARRHRSAQTHFSTWVGERSAQVIRERDKTKPLFLMAGFFDPHNPYDHCPPESETWLHEEFYEPPIPDDVSRMPEGARWEACNHRPKADGDSPEALMHAMRRGYYAGISFLDAQVGKILRALREEGLYDDTLIVFTSDHGDMLGDHGLYFKGAMFYEQGVNVPLLVKYPGQTAQKRSEELVQLRDLFSTLYVCAGGAAALRPESLPLQGDEKRDFALTAYRGCGKFDINGFPHPLHATMIRTRDWKLNLYHDTCQGQLFHLRDDPDELNDLYNDPLCARRALDMAQLYLRFSAQRERRLNASAGGMSPVPGFAFPANK